MIEIICNEENSDKSKQVTRGAAIRRPKNIKQIGEVSSDKKIYIEDYAFTYINSIAYNNPSDSQAGVLLGENQTDGDEKCVFIKGIIKAKLGTEVEEKGVYFNESVWNGIYSDVEKYFPDLSVVGWFAAIPEVTPERMMKLKKIHLDNFAGTMKTFYLIDTVEKEENFYLYENGELKKQKGYVCFYERNYEMQEYMLERRERKSSEDGPDKVMKSIRNIIREKEELHEQKKNAFHVSWSDCSRMGPSGEPAVCAHARIAPLASLTIISPIPESDSSRTSSMSGSLGSGASLTGRSTLYTSPETLT